MMKTGLLLIAGAAFCLQPLTRAEAQALPPASAQILAASLRAFLIQALPQPLYEKSPGWGTTKEVTTGVKLKGKLHLRPEAKRERRNHGNWRKVRITADNPAGTAVVEVRDLRRGPDGKVLFTTFIALNARVEYEHQKWDTGVRVYSGSARARLRLKLTLDCEMTSRLEQNGGLLPEFVFRLRVTHADLRYDRFVVEHVLGMGGDMAQLLGKAIKGGAERLHPGIERHLLEKANAAIEKAADTKEVRLGLSSLVKP